MPPLKAKLSTWLHRHARLTDQEFAALKDVGKKPMERTISDKHRDCLIAAGYIREVVRHSGSISALALTGHGLRRLERGK